MHKNILTTFLQHFPIVLSKKRLEKKANLKNESILKIAKNGHQPKAIDLQNRHFGSKIKNEKNEKKKRLKTFLKHIAAVLCKKQLEKPANFRKKKEYFENCQKWPPSKGYRLCKIVTLGQKLKMLKNMLKAFLQHIAVVPCKSGSRKQLIVEA